MFKVARTGSTSERITISLGWSGGATFGTDYTVAASGGTLGANAATITLAAGVASATITVKPVDDKTVEGAETVVLTVGAGVGYAVGSPASATGTIADNDTPPIETIGDDITWMRFGDNGRLYAINPEAGFFGVAPGTSEATNANAIATLRGNSIFTNVALTDNGDVWWEDLTDPPPAHLTDWKGRDWAPGSPEPAAHPNSRFTAPAAQCPVIAPEWDNPAGVPISAILFGGRRASAVPLVTEAFDWEHGVFLGATIASERTAAADGNVGELRRDPFAMLPFCGYNMGDYFAHWLDIGRSASTAELPRIYFVNWFRRDESGRFLWPGFGENSRVLKWIIERLSGDAQAAVSPIGNIPRRDALDTDGLDIDEDDLTLLLSVDTQTWKREATLIREHLRTFGGGARG